MTLNTVTLMWDLSDLVESGVSATLSITPTAQMSDTTDHILIPPVPRSVTFSGGTGELAGIVANDDTQITPTGTGYLISVVSSAGQVIVPQFQTQILYASGATQWLDQLAPVAVVTTSYQYALEPSGTIQPGAMPTATVSGSPQTTWGPTVQAQQLLSAVKSPALAPWWAGLANRAFAQANVVCIGDSITLGQGASVMDNRWLGRLRVLLNSRFPTPGITTSGRGIISCTGTLESSFTYPVVMNGSPSKLNHGVRGGDSTASGAYQLNAAGQSFVFTLNGDSADIMWDQAVAAGQFSWQVDSGSTTTVSTAGASGQDGKLTHISLGSAGAHTVTLAWVSSTATVDGVTEYNGDYGSAVHTHDCGHYGWKTSDWVTALGGGAITGPAGAIAALAPNVVLIMLMTNDQTQSVLPATSGANLATIIADIRAAVSATPDPAFVLIVPPPRGSQSTQTYPWSQYAAQAWAVAAADSQGLVSVLDFTQGPRMAGPDTDLYSLWAGDHVHPDNNGHEVIADYVAAYLTHG